MTSQRKIEANRRNAEQSTGPKTVNGKAHSRYNALKSGIYAASRLLPGEDREAYRRIALKLKKLYAPADPVEELIVDQILGHIWRIERLERAEKAYLSAVGRSHVERHRRFDHMAIPPPGDAPSENIEDGTAEYFPCSRNNFPCSDNNWAERTGPLETTFLEASVCRTESQPLRYLFERRNAHLGEVTFLEQNLEKRRRHLLTARIQYSASQTKNS